MATWLGLLAREAVGMGTDLTGRGGRRADPERTEIGSNEVYSPHQFPRTNLRAFGRNALEIPSYTLEALKAITEEEYRFTIGEEE